MASNKNSGSRVRPEDRCRPVVVNKPAVGAPIVKPIPNAGNPVGQDYATNGKPLGVSASQNAPNGKSPGQAAARKQRPMMSYNREK